MRLTCTVRRIGDYDSRTEEYELSFSCEDGEPRGRQIRYQAARAYEINAALDTAAEIAREAIATSSADPTAPNDEALSQFAWRAIQSAKYEEGAPKTSHLDV